VVASDGLTLVNRTPQLSAATGVSTPSGR